MMAGLIVVAGASSGIGQGIAVRLAQGGHSLALLDLVDSSETAHRARQHGASAHSYRVNVSDETSVAEAFEELDRTQGAPEGLVNAAGVFLDTPFLDTSAKDWDKVLAVNAKGPFLVGQAAASRMKDNGGGAIVNILSNAAAQGFAQESAYCASKGAALLLTRTMAVELARYQITVNGVGPGTSETPMGSDYLGDGPIAAHELSRTPLQRWGQPQDIAESVAFFIDKATWVTGQALYVDGGFLATGLPQLDGL